jgi:hypothetical protein
MNNRTPIQNELQTVAPGLAHLPVAMPYIVPPGYFDNFSDKLIPLLKKNDFNLTFLPDKKSMPYQVPTGYFENLATAILQKVTASQAVPEGYFDTLPAMILNKVRRLEVSQELETIAPLLNTISKQPVQSVPEGYFENLQPLVDGVTTKATPIVSIKKKLGWLKYSVAASVILILSFGAYRYFDRKPVDGFTAVTPEQVKVLDKQLAQLDNATIEAYLQENESVTELNADWYKNVQEDDIEYLLQDFTDQELQQQLKENASFSTTTKQKT